MSTGREIIVKIEGLSFNDMNKLSYISGQPSQDGTQNQDVSRTISTVKASVLGNALSTIFVGQISEAYADYRAAPKIIFLIKARDISKLEQKVGDQIGYKEPMAPSAILSDICARNGLVFADHGGWGDDTKLRFAYMDGDVKKQITTLVHAAKGFCRFDQHGPVADNTKANERDAEAKSSKTSGGEAADKGAKAAPKKTTSQESAAAKPMTTLHAWGSYALAGHSDDETISEVSAASGMIGYPQYAPTGCTLTCIFRPDISFLSRIRVQSRYLLKNSTHANDESAPTTRAAHERKNPWDGLWTATSVTHELSSEVENGPWLTTVACVSSDKANASQKAAANTSKPK